MIRTKRAVPSVPRISIGTQMCLSMSTNLPMPQAASWYSWEKRPVILRPKMLKTNHMITRASRKLGVPTPRYDRKVKKWSIIEYCLTAETMATGMARVHVKKMVNRPRVTVMASRSAINWLTGRLNSRDMPMSP